ncbi:putative bzip transcription factor [Phaeomoniella chlamydospora]|uniref:Putative bzip transcription factor n=1 Tax=Phaeomoniella chlamydospora TaxID=158046 RepID=A0A0G2EP99_PHACM|nr:putative bzip transcription factor [Phaeomoniella chlamydospora]
MASTDGNVTISAVIVGMGTTKDMSAPGGLNYMQGFVGAAAQKKMTRGRAYLQITTTHGLIIKSPEDFILMLDRTHRERKEQYIKGLEVEISGLREGYASDVTRLNTTIAQHKDALRQQQEENAILKDLLQAHGISFQRELESRKAQFAVIANQNHGYPPNAGAMSHGPTSHTGSFSTVTPTGTTVGALTPSPRLREGSYNNGIMNTITPTTAATSYPSQSPPDHSVSERSFKREDSGISQYPGVFERDPQLGIDFILALEHTCRDHGEYLIRRSVNSPDDEEEAQISGHALMASCPPPSHIANTPAQGGGFVPTYPHQVPQIPYENLMTLLNLSRRMVEQGDIEGGQITPIMALQHLRSHRSYKSLTKEDVQAMIDTLNSKVRCYGFGAVMEDFELLDVMTNIFATKGESYDEVFGGSNADEDMYS